MTGANRAQFLASYGVANQDWPVEMKRVENSKHVVAQAIGVIA
jgi:hypothetical protein